MCDVAAGRDWLMARVVERLSAFDALAIRAVSQGMCRVAEVTAANLVAELRGWSQATTPEAHGSPGGAGYPRPAGSSQAPREGPAEAHRSQGGKVRWLRALRELHRPPRLVCMGGYNSNWNRHEPVFQDSDADGSECSAEVVCTLTGEGASRWGRSFLPAMLHPRADVAACGGKETGTLLAVGGRAGMERHTYVEYLDLVAWRLRSEGWQARPPMLQGRSGHVLGKVDDKLLVAGGRGVAGVFRSAELCNLSGDCIFAPLPDMQAPREYAASAVLSSEFWVMGGGETGRCSSTEIFDVAAGFWRPGPEMRESRYGGSALFHDGRIFVVGGSVHFGRRKFTTLETLDPREGSWESHHLQAPARSSYECSLWGSGVVAHGDALYLCGGTFRGLDQSLNSVYRIDLRTMQYGVLREALSEDSPAANIGLQVPRWCGAACIV